MEVGFILFGAGLGMLAIGLNLGPELIGRGSYGTAACLLSIAGLIVLIMGLVLVMKDVQREKRDEAMAEEGLEGEERAEGD